MNRMEMKPKDPAKMEKGELKHSPLVTIKELEPEISRGAASFALKLDNVKVLKARAGCNLHGIWTTSVTF